MSGFEFAILDFIQKNIASPIMDKIMVFISSLGNAGAVWIVIALLLMCSKKHRKTGIVLAAGLVMSLVFGNLLLKPLVARPRPFQVREGIELIITAPRDFSFPSGHTLVSVISAVILLLRNRRMGILAAVLALFIAFSRLYLYVHFPTDVFFGIILGIAIGVLCVKVFDKNFQKNTTNTN